MSTLGINHSTDELIDTLAGDLAPVRPSALPFRLAFGVGAGALISGLLLVFIIGIRPNLGSVIGSAGFWSKVAFTLATAGLSLLVAARLGRPGSRTSLLWILPVPLLMYLPFGIWELAHTAHWLPLLLGHGWKQCTWLVLILSVPVYLGLWWSLRKFAPTQMEVAGAVAGLCASAVASVVYCLHCPTDTAVFALTWYTLAFVLATVAGAFLGRRMLRW